jgi:hypothetical protein
LVFDDKGNGPAELHGDFRGHGVGVGHTANAVGSEEFFHRLFLVVVEGKLSGALQLLPIRAGCALFAE